MNTVVHITKKQVEETLAVTSTPGKKSLEPFRTFAKENNLPIKIIENHQTENNEAEVHMREADLWFCLEGEVTFRCGGELIEPRHVKQSNGNDDPNELKAKLMHGGTEHVLRQGEWLWVSAGVPHQDSSSGTARLILIKVPLSNQK